MRSLISSRSIKPFWNCGKLQLKTGYVRQGVGECYFMKQSLIFQLYDSDL